MSGKIIHASEMKFFPDAVYIGRDMRRQRFKGSIWANPYKITEPSDLGPGISRHMACLMYRDYLRSSIAGRPLLAMLPELRGKPLACWCRKSDASGRSWQECHGDQILRLLDEHTDAELIAMSKMDPSAEEPTPQPPS